MVLEVPFIQRSAQLLYLVTSMCRAGQDGSGGVEVDVNLLPDSHHMHVGGIEPQGRWHLLPAAAQFDIGVEHVKITGLAGQEDPLLVHGVGHPEQPFSVRHSLPAHASGSVGAMETYGAGHLTGRLADLFEHHTAIEFSGDEGLWIEG